MARHSQQGTSPDFRCESCYRHDCEKCIDKARAKLIAHGHMEPAPAICKCRRKEHNRGEGKPVVGSPSE